MDLGTSLTLPFLTLSYLTLPYTLEYTTTTTTLTSSHHHCNKQTLPTQPILSHSLSLSYLLPGVPHSELRTLINESDENQDGVIQFKEFVPLAVDMIMTFTAR